MELTRGITHWEVIPPKEGSFAPPLEDSGLHPRIIHALGETGIHRLYTHQEEAWRIASSGRDLVVVTSTASGKSLCYNLPVFDRLLRDDAARALYLFPTKALSRDQEARVAEMSTHGGFGLKVATYDGDTPSSLRAATRDSGRIILSNPDMLHSGILPNHTKWWKFFGSLAFVVIDEIHLYRGVFGAGVTNLLRRLRRVCQFYNSNPVFICSSATIGNPRELTETLLERPVEMIDRNGAPHGERNLILYNPPLLDEKSGIRKGSINEAQRWAVYFLRKGIKSIIFAKSRLRSELLAEYIRRSLGGYRTESLREGEGRIRVETYRGGYLPRERRAIEGQLRDGTIQGVVSTNALELGIDIGELDLAILTGFPGSIASCWQQAGRAGRRSTLSAAIFVASSSPTDQYIVSHPEYLLSKSAECGFIDPDNPYILTAHLKCALFELPMKKGEEFGGNVDEILDYLAEEGVLRFTEGTYYWSDRSYPAEEVSLRSTTNQNVVIVDVTGAQNQVIGQMDLSSAKEMLFDGAIYLHRGEQYKVESLDLEKQLCRVEPSKANYYTDSVTKSDIKVLTEDRVWEEDGVQILLGDLLVRKQVSKYKKLKFHTHENLGYGVIHLPEDEIHTWGTALSIKKDGRAGSCFENLPMHEQQIALVALAKLIENVAPLFLLCDRKDLGVSERIRDPHTKLPTIFVYDNHPGGTGMAEGLSRILAPLLGAVLELLENCPCQDGCPSCVGSIELPILNLDRSALDESGGIKGIALKLLIPWLKEERGEEAGGA